MGQVAIVIPNWNSLHFLRACLSSVAAQEAETEVIVVDNGSTDGSQEWLSENGVPHISLPENIGFASAVNLGIVHTSSDNVVILNADALLMANCIPKLAETLDRKPHVGGVQPCILQCQDSDISAGPILPDGEAVVYSLGQALTHDGRAYERGQGTVLASHSVRSGEIFGVCGAACMIRRDLLVETGGYEETFFAFYEDVELNVKAQAAGWSFELVSDALAWHVGNAVWKRGFTKPNAENARLVARNRLATQIEFMPFRAIPRIIVVEVGSLYRAFKERRLRATLKGKMQGLAKLPWALSRRRSLRINGDPRRPRHWLGHS